MKIDLKKFDKLTANQWEDKIVYRGIHRKYKKLLISLLPMYTDKVDNRLTPRLENLQFFLNNKLTFNNLSKFLKVFSLDIFEEHSHAELKEIAEEEVEFLNRKILRITDKYAAITKEIYLRDNKLVKRTPHGTIYYIDLDAGDDGLDGLTTGNAWLTIEKYTTVEVRTAGDIAKVRAATSQVFAAELDFDEDGNAEALLTLKGCDSVDDPWSDASDVRPILDFNDTTKYVYLNGDNYWKLQNLDIKGGNNTIYGGVRIYITNHFYFNNCRVYENGKNGLYISNLDRAEIKNCEFYSNIGSGIKVNATISNLIIKNCIFNGGVDTTDYGIYSEARSSALSLEDCSFGQTTAHDTKDIFVRGIPIIYFRNCIYTSIGWYTTNNQDKGRRFYKEDDGQIFEAHKIENYDITIERDTSIVRAGGADSSLKMTPSEYIGLYRKVTSYGEHGEIVKGTFKVWLSASVEKTITIYIRGFGWTGFPTASQLFVRASYLSNGATAARTEIDSDEVIANNNDWVEFQVTLTPARDGFVYLDVFLGDYEASSGVYVDIKPVIS